MKRLILLASLSLVSGCMSVGSGDAICAGTDVSRTEHAAALALDGGPQSVVTGAVLIRQIDAACRFPAS